MEEKTDYLNAANPPTPDMNGVGRPTVMTDQVLLKLEHAFAHDCTDLEACLYAGISKSAFYAYQDEHPEFKDRKELLKQTPVLAARQAVIKSFSSHPKIALDYLQLKNNKEFSKRVENKNINYEGLSLIREEEIEGVEPQAENSGTEQSSSDPAAPGEE